MVLKLTQDEASEFQDAVTILGERIENAAEGGFLTQFSSSLSAVERLLGVVDSNIETSVGLYVFIPVITEELQVAVREAISCNLEHYEERMSEDFSEDLLVSHQLTKDLYTKVFRA